MFNLLYFSSSFIYSLYKLRFDNFLLNGNDDDERCYTVVSCCVYFTGFCFICFTAHECLTDPSCVDAFLIDSTCYKIHKEPVRWFTAVNRCLSYNASLAVFDDYVLETFPSSLLSDNAWIGLVKSWWTWPGLGQCWSLMTINLMSLPQIWQNSVKLAANSLCEI